MSQMIIVAAATTIPVTNAAKQENSRCSFRMRSFRLGIPAP
jgi:hypothetical protein